MNVLKRELRGGFRTVLIWTLIVAGLNVMMIAFIKSFTMDAQALQEFIKAFPPELIKAFGLDRISLAEPIGYYATEVYLIVILAGSIFAALTGASLLAKEEDEKTVEFLLARPVSRGSVVVQKALACVVFLLFFNGVITAVNLVGYAVMVEQEYSQTALLQLSIAPFFAQLAFAGLAFLSGIFWTRRRAVYSVVLAMTMGTYFLGMVSLISERMAWLRWFSPFRYVEAADIAIAGSIHLPYALGLTAVSIACVGIANLIYAKRDISV